MDQKVSLPHGWTVQPLRHKGSPTRMWTLRSPDDDRGAHASITITNLTDLTANREYYEQEIEIAEQTRNIAPLGFGNPGGIYNRIANGPGYVTPDEEYQFEKFEASNAGDPPPPRPRKPGAPRKVGVAATIKGIVQRVTVDDHGNYEVHLTTVEMPDGRVYAEGVAFGPKSEVPGKSLKPGMRIRCEGVMHITSDIVYLRRSHAFTRMLPPGAKA